MYANVYLFPICVQWRYLRSLKLAMVRLLSPRKSTNGIPQSFSVWVLVVSREPAVKHLLPHHCVFWNSCWRINAILHFYQKYMRVPVSPTASPTVYCQTFEVYQTCGLEIFSHCGFDLHFSYYKQTWASFFIYLRIIVYIFLLTVCPWFLPIFLTQFWSFVFIYFEEYISLY